MVQELCSDLRVKELCPIVGLETLNFVPELIGYHFIEMNNDLWNFCLGFQKVQPHSPTIIINEY